LSWTIVYKVFANLRVRNLVDGTGELISEENMHLALRLKQEILWI